MAIPRSSPVSAKAEERKQDKKKRTENPGVRMIGRRIYDSGNGKTCHQCRQKTLDFAASCKNVKNGKACTIKFCYKCLLNRYGEKAVEVEALQDWSCPKCRGVCNCSFCMKKKGHKPTGILVHAAKKIGFSSVTEMLHYEGSLENAEKKLNDVGVSPKKTPTPKKGEVHSKLVNRKQNKDKQQEDLQMSKHREKESGSSVKKMGSSERKQLKHKIDSEQSSGSKRVKHERCQARMESLKTAVKGETEELLNRKEKEISAAQVSGTKIGNKKKLSKAIFSNKDVPQEGTKTDALNLKRNHKLPKYEPERSVISSPCKKIVIPDGEPMLVVCGVDLPVDGVGPALQFLEFCKAFSKVLGIRKGQPETILKEMANPRVVRHNRVSCSPVVQFHMKLLSLIQKDKGQESLESSNRTKSWLQDLEKYAHESEYVPEFPLAGNGTASLEYDSLELSEKLGILNFLCNEALGTDKLRRSIDEEIVKFNEKKKEAIENVVASKAKKKDLQQKLKDEIARAMLSSRGGVPLSISDYDNLISNIKAEAKRARAEITECQELLRNRNQRSDAVRTEPMLQDSGRVYWRLEGSGISNVKCQDVGNVHLVKTKDRWFVLRDEHEQVLVKYITSKRLHRLKRCAAVTEDDTAGS